MGASWQERRVVWLREEKRPEGEKSLRRACLASGIGPSFLSQFLQMKYIGAENLN
jgi:hypothetical protein